MYRTATITIYDCLDQIVVGARVWTHDDAGWDQGQADGHWYSTFPGKGTDDTLLWLWEAIQNLQVQLDTQK
jgi:hypothetical protein